MSKSKYLKNIIKGGLLADAFSCIVLIILSVVMIKFDISKTIYDLIYKASAVVFLILFSAACAKANERKGYLSGFFVGIVFYLGILIIVSIFKDDLIFNVGILLKFVLCSAIGAVSGMIGVNM